MEVIRETLCQERFEKRCLSTPTKPPAKNSNICLSETAYQHKGTRKKCKKTNQAAIIQWQRQCLSHIASPDRSRKQATFLSRVPVHCIRPFCSDALVSPPNLYPPCFSVTSWPAISLRGRRLKGKGRRLGPLFTFERRFIFSFSAKYRVKNKQTWIHW